MGYLFRQREKPSLERRGDPVFQPWDSLLPSSELMPCPESCLRNYYRSSSKL
jgi:hypothetical protein